MKHLLTLFFIAFSLFSYSQTTGSIVGKLTDIDYNNEPLAFANVIIKGTSTGTISDIDGLYALENMSPGTYTVVYSFVGYKTVEIENVNVEADKVTSVNVPMSASAAALGEVLIKTTARRDSEVALLLEQKKAVIITQAISSEDLAKKGVSDAEGAVTKVTGIKKQAGVKNVFVRGLGDRYNSTTLNELPLPSEDPEYKNISLDFFSSDVIQSVGINKTFSVPVYGDVAGANIDIVTKELSGKGNLQFTITPEVNTRAIGKPFLTLDGANYIGNIEHTHVPIKNLTVYNFDHSFKPETQNAQLNSSYSLSGGKRFDIGDDKLSVFFVGNFDSKYEYREGVSDRINSAGGYAQDFDATEYIYNVSKLAMGNIKYRFSEGDFIAVNSMFIRSNSQKVGDFYGTKSNLTENDEEGNPVRAFIRRQQENENNLFVNQLLGEFTLTEKIGLEAGASYNTIRGFEPDRRTNTYVVDVNSNTARAASGSALNSRFYSNLEENELAGKLYLNYKLGNEEEGTKQNSKIRVGYNYRNTDRTFNYSQINYIFNSPAVVDINNPDTSLFNQESLNNGIFSLTTNRGDGRDGSNPFAPFFYTGDRQIHAGMAEITYDFSENFTANIGARYESVNQTVEFDTNLASSSNATTEPSFIEENYILPSFNLKYNFNENSIVRVAGSKTYTFPQFKEVAPFLYEDVTFNSFGNPNLLPADNYNFDLKYEYYFSAGEIIAVTGFYKKIKNAINRIEVNSSAGELSYVNTGDANVAGVEFELRKDIFSTSNNDKENSLAFGLNASYLYSNQKLKDVPTDELTVRFTNEEDELEGSSPFILTSDLTYSFKNGDRGLISSLVYNYNSKSIYSIGTGGDDANPGSGRSNIELASLSTLDFINRYSLNEHLGLKLGIKNILDPEYRLFQKVNNIGVPNPILPDGEEVTIQTYKRGVTISLGISYKF